MLFYYFKLFIRQFKRQKLFSSINILGLSSGICTALIIYLYVDHELSYDKFHKNVDNIYRVNQTFIWGENTDEQFGSTGPGVALALEAELPEVKKITRLHPPGEYLVTYSSQNNQLISFNEKKILAADSNFFDMFSFPLIKGNPETVLQKPQSLVLSESTAKKYFNSSDPIGRLLSLELNGKTETYSVTGIVEDPPSNTHIQFDMLMSMSSLPRVKKQNWTWIWTTFVTFVQLDDQADINAVRTKLEDIPPKYAGISLQRVFNTTFEDYIKDGKEWELFLQPLTDIHLSSESLNRISAAGNGTIVYSLAWAAVFIILLSCINFMNLSTSQYMTRAKFTGIRKILGSSRKELTRGYVAEAFIYCSIALAIGIISAYYLLPFFNAIVDQQLTFNLLSNWRLGAVSVGLLIIMSLLAGSYPAIFLSAFNVIDTLKGKLKSGKESKPIRNTLVVVQFASSIVLITCTLVVFGQLRFTQEKDLGFKRDNLISMKNLEWVENSESLVNELEQIPGIESVSLCSSMPPELWGGDKFNPVNAPVEIVSINYTTGDENYIPSLGLRLIDGRNFSSEINEEHNIIVNQSTLKSIGWDPNESAVGKKIKYPGYNPTFEIVGVVSDFNYWSLNAPIEPFALFNIKSPIYAGDKQFAAISIANVGNITKSAYAQKVLSQLESKWSEFTGSRPFEYHFVDDAFASTFQDEQQFAQVLTVFAALAILIALLGLFGIIIYTIDQKTKEIGIRKVVGAELWHIAVLLSKGHLKLILLSIAVGIPVSVWLMENWLNDFRYRVDISPLIFVSTALGVILVSLAITGYHSIQASKTNPVDVLKDD